MAGDHTGRRPVSNLTTVSRGEMLGDPVSAQKRIDRVDPEGQWGLGVARVTEIDYEELFVTLQVLIGASGDAERVPIPMTFPGAGARHFLGSFPHIGDYCVVGWMPQESSNSRNRTPVILGWVVPGVWPGKEWVTTSNFSHDETDFGAQFEKDVVRGVLPRIRHKLRHGQPGNILASSSQGSDLVLDEGVTLSNRRGNEFRLRDQDQAAVLRALQRFDALCGTRIYSGMVQRDAQFLTPTMVSDGKIWDDKQVVSLGRPIHENDLAPDLANPEGALTPARIFSRRFDENGNPGATGIKFGENVDPFLFLQQGGFIDSTGMAADSRFLSDAIYGGKPFFRVAAQSGKNAVLDPKIPTLTEHRLEIQHTSDGRLPVTEQTDLFDADRLPTTDPDTPKTRNSAPFIEVVYGSVIGNDPFTALGREAYGRPLVPKVFDGDVPNPRLDPVDLVFDVGDGSTPDPIEQHAAFLFRLNPLTEGSPTFWSVNKKGQLRAAIGGPQRENSVEASLAGGLKLSVAGELKLLLDGEIELGTKSRNPVQLRSEKGPVTIYGGGSIQGAESVGERFAGTGGRESNLPSVDIQARTNLRLKATKKVFVKGSVIDAEASSTRIKGHDLIELATSRKMRVQAEDAEFVVTGKRTDNFSGPKNFLPTSGPLHERIYTASQPGLTDEKVTYNFGNREEEFKLGNHSTRLLVGDASYECVLGKIRLQGTSSTLELSSNGISAQATLGDINLSAVAGSLSMTAFSSVFISSTAGTSTLRGSQGVFLSAPTTGTDFGPIVCGGSLEPFTGLPFSTFGIGATNHVVTS